MKTEVLSPEVLPVAGVNEQMTRAEIDVQIATARQYPRVVGQCSDEMKSMSTLSREVAESCFFVLPRGNKKIDGPSVRLAEIVAMSWGHIRAGSRILEVGDKFIIAEGYCHDLQNNNLNAVQVRRRITDRDGNRYNEDMINVTCQAAAAIAYRNAVFKVVPRTIWQGAYDAARTLAIGDASTLNERRDAMVKHFGSLDIDEKRVLAAVDRGSVEEITLNDLSTLIGIATGIKNGEINAADAFPEPQADASKALANAPKKELEKPDAGGDEKEKTPAKSKAKPAAKDQGKDAELPLDEKQPPADSGQGPADGDAF